MPNSQLQAGMLNVNSTQKVEKPPGSVYVSNFVLSQQPVPVTTDSRGESGWEPFVSAPKAAPQSIHLAAA